MTDKIEKIHEMICNECQSALYYPPKDYQECSQRILNASTLLYNEALNTPSQGKGVKTNLSLQNLTDLLYKIYKILQNSEIWPLKEQEIKEVLKNNRLIPEHFLTLDTWQDGFVERLE